MVVVRGAPAHCGSAAYLPAEAAEAMTGSAISVVAQPCLRVNPRHVNRDIAAVPSRGVGRAASQRRAFARDTIPLWVYASGSPIIHRRNRRSVRRLIWAGTPSLLAMAQPQPLSCCHRFGQASIQASASYSFMERTSLCHSGRWPAARIRANQKVDTKVRKVNVDIG